MTSFRRRGGRETCRLATAKEGTEGSMRLRTLMALNAAGWLSLLATASAQPPRVGSVLNCTPGTISGSYGYVNSGFIAAVPYVEYGQFAADGKGSFAGSSTVSVGGAIAARVLSGNYYDDSGVHGHFGFSRLAGECGAFHIHRRW